MVREKFNFLITLRSTFLVIFWMDYQHKGKKNTNISDLSEMEFNLKL